MSTLAPAPATAVAPAPALLDPATGTPYPLCAREMHQLTPANRWKGGARCIECKRQNDRVNYEAKKAAAAGTPLSQDELDDLRKRAAVTVSGAVGRGARAKGPLAAVVAPSAFAAAAAEVSDKPKPKAGGPPEPTSFDDGPAVRRGYRSRDLAGMADIEALQRARTAGLATMLYGPPGAGKSDLVRSAFPDVITLNGDGDTLVDDFVGGWTPTGEADKYVWIDGPLVRAMRLGLPFFIDDATLISPKVLAIVYPVMDGRGWVQVKGHPIETEDGEWGPDLVQAAEGFFILGGHNPGVHGAILTEALASRFSIHVNVTTSYQIARKMKIDPRVIKIAENMITQQGAGEVGWAPQMRELLAYQDVARIWGETAAISNLIGVCPEEDRPALRLHCKSVFGETVNALALGSEAK